jgi:transcriptional regulator with XRE-family HTH domain
MSLGSKLSALRLKKGTSLQAVADAVGISKAHYWELEKGKSKNPSADLVKRLADHFGVDVGFLVGAENASVSELQEAQLFYRDLKSLNEQDRELILHNIKMLKDRGKK